MAELLDFTSLAGFGGRYPHELPGGQQQRVTLARALAPRPDLLLLDQPFSSLDTTLRKQVRADVVGLLQDAGVTAILVTQDPEEALAFADHIAVMQKGHIIQS